MTGITVAQYLRISDEDDDREESGKAESESISGQRRLLEEYIASQPEFAGASVVEFCDDGWSGKDFRRPAFLEMMDQVKHGMIQCIVVKDLSRFGRDYLTVGNYISRVFPFLGIRFIAVNDGFDNIRPDDADSLQTAFQTLVYDFYSRDLSRKVRSAREVRAQRGECLSPLAPYGYAKDAGSRNHLVADPEAAGIVRRIFRMAADGWRPARIAGKLNRERILTPMRYKQAAGCRRTWPCVREENFWTGGTVAKILRDERYTGRAVYGKKKRDGTGGSRAVKAGRADWITVDDAHEGIITRGEFDLAQKALRRYGERAASVSGKKRLLDGKVRCGVCGHIMTRVSAKQPCYVCNVPRLTDAYACAGERLAESRLLEILRDGLRALIFCLVEPDHIREEELRRLQRTACDAAKALAGRREECAVLRERLPGLYEKYVFGETCREEYLKEKEAVAGKIKDAAEEIGELEEELRAAVAAAGEKKCCKNRPWSAEEAGELAERIAADVLGEILVYPDCRIQIVWDFAF